MVGHIRVGPVVDLCVGAMRCGVQRVVSGGTVRGVATFVFITTVDDIRMNAFGQCPDFSRVALEACVGGIVVIMGTRDGRVNQSD